VRPAMHPDPCRGRVSSVSYAARCSFCLFGMPAQHFSRQGHIGKCATRTLVVNDNRTPVTGRLGQADIAGYYGAVDLVAEELLELVGNLLGKAVARVEHGADDT